MTHSTTRFCALLLSIATIPAVGSTGPQPYAASSIPAELRENAHAVVRESREEFVIYRPDAATYRVQHAVTVLNDNGDRFASLAIYYDKQHKISDVRCEIFDAAGRSVKRVRNKDLTDRSVTSYSLYADNRLLSYEYQTNNYPYTLVYSYEEDYDGILYCPRWQPVEGFGLSVEQSSFTVSAPANAPFRSRAHHVKATDSTATAEGITTTWQVTNLLAQQQEPFQPALSTLTPTVVIAPTRFEFEGYAGTMDSWKSFGQWVYQLNAGRNQLPETTQQAVKQLVAEVPDTMARVKKLYEYMQSKTRYVSIQLGIGGYQPFEARTVDELGYGDCKALSNYMQSLLQVANIPSRYILVRAGRGSRDILTDFPSTQFNHAILCVPMERDTLWLECTSQTNPVGHTGYFTSGRHALLIDETGGHLVKIPHTTQPHNAQTRRGSLRLDDEGNGTLEVTTHYAGLQYDHVDNIVRLSAAEQQKQLYERIDLPNFRLLSYAYQQDKQPVPTTEEHLTLSVSGYASVSGKRWFINPNVLSQWDYLPAQRTNRQTPVEIDYAYVDTDSMEIILPENLYAEYAPEPIVIESPFGEYRSTYTIEQGRVIYQRTLRINRGTFPAEQYEELVNFYRSVATADQEKVVLKKTT
ncbi:MAG: DUF3857 domain-containing protein [Tunicatimonas sp.]